MGSGFNVKVISSKRQMDHRRITRRAWAGLFLLLLAACQAAPLTPTTPPSPPQAVAPPVLAIATQPAAAVSPTATPEPSPTLTLTPAPSLTPTPAYPESFYIRNITGHGQAYALSCEASAAVDWANFFGVAIYESNFQIELPISDNPDYGYVGDPTTRGWGQIPPYAYGVHADPVANLLVAYGLPAKSVKGYSLEQVMAKLAEGKPILVWIIGNMEYSEPVEYIDKQGRTSIVAPFEHAVILTGYNQETIRYMSNGKFYDVPHQVFLTSWGVLGNMAVIAE